MVCEYIVTVSIKVVDICQKFVSMAFVGKTKKACQQWHAF